MNDMIPMGVEQSQSKVEIVNAYLRGVYRWMLFGLLITALSSYLTVYTPLSALFYNVVVDQASGTALMAPTMLFWALIIGELGLVFYLIARISRLSAMTASGLFLFYSLLNGVTISSILLIYTFSSVVYTFLICAVMFGGMSLYGLITKKDLTSWGSFLIMGLFGVLLAMIVNIFLGSQQLGYVISIIGVLVFTGLTAYDTQRLKVMGESMPAGDATAVRRGTILGALTLYLDFINLFLMLLQLFGSRR